MSDPLKEGHHFDQTLGGIAGLFENIRSNTHVCKGGGMISRWPLLNHWQFLGDCQLSP